MTGKVFQQYCVETAIYKKNQSIDHLAYVVLGLASEAGEVAGKLKKLYRDAATEKDRCELRSAMADELGDVLWYAAMIADELNTTLDIVMDANIAKLKDRALRGTLRGSGDNR